MPDTTEAAAIRRRLQALLESPAIAALRFVWTTPTHGRVAVDGHFFRLVYEAVASSSIIAIDIDVSAGRPGTMGYDVLGDRGRIVAAGAAAGAATGERMYMLGTLIFAGLHARHPGLWRYEAWLVVTVAQLLFERAEGRPPRTALGLEIAAAAARLDRPGRMLEFDDYWRGRITAALLSDPRFPALRAHPGDMLAPQRLAVLPASALR